MDVRQPESERARSWLSRGVGGIGAASFLADVGHEVPTALLVSLVNSTLGAPAAALGLIEGISDGLAGAGRFAGGALADDPRWRRRVAVGGYTVTAVLSSLIGVAGSAVQVGVLRGAAWAARGLRVPARNALLADVVPPAVYGRAYGFERTMDNLGAIVGPLLALGLVAAVGVRTAILLSVIPGLLAAASIGYAIHHARLPAVRDVRERRRLRFQVRPVLRGQLGRLLGAFAAFEVGNLAATLLILRATDLLTPGRGVQAATEVALGLYTAYNVAATVVSLPAGRLSDRLGARGPVLVVAAGAVAFLGSYLLFAVSGPVITLLAVAFIAAGIGIGCAETAENAAVAAVAPEALRGSAFGLLATVQAGGNLAASAVAGLLYTVASPSVAFCYVAGWMLLALLGLTGVGLARAPHRTAASLPAMPAEARPFRLARSDDPALELVLGGLTGSVVTVAERGSYHGLGALARGEADGAAIHLRHRSGGYNAEFARSVLRGRQPVLIHLWRREQGFIVPAGNPHHIATAADLAGLRLAKRLPGTGTRALLDQQLTVAGITPDDVPGPEVDSHFEVALAVATGTADAGLGVRAAAADLDLDFVPLLWEHYDLALPADALDAAAPVLTALRDSATRQVVEHELAGYDLTHTGRIESLTASIPP